MRGPKFGKGSAYWQTAFLNKCYTGKYIPSIVCQAGEVHCPDKKEQVHFSECVQCEKFQVWHEKDGEFRRCHHEFLEMESRGFYDGTWNDHPENFAPDAFAKIQKSKQLNEEINREMEVERNELEWRSEELEKNSESLDEYFKNKYGGYDEEDDFEEEFD